MNMNDLPDNEINEIGENINRNLSALLKNNGITLTMLSRNTGIAIPTIKRLQSDETTNPTITTLLPIADFFGISINQLVAKNTAAHKATGYIENKLHWLQVPLLTWEQAIEWPNEELKQQTHEFILADIDLGESPYALTVNEDDWIQISKGSILIINRELFPENKDYAVVYKTGHSFSALKQVIIDEDKVYLRSLNPHVPSSLLSEGYSFLGVLVQIRKNIRDC